MREKVAVIVVCFRNCPASDTGSALPHPTGASSLSGSAPAVTFNNTVVGSGGTNAAGNSVGVGGSSSTPVNLPAVLKDRVPSNLRLGSGAGSRGPPPPVPPRSPKRVNIAVPTSQGGVLAGPNKGDKTASASFSHVLHHHTLMGLLFYFQFDSFFLFCFFFFFCRIEHDDIILIS